MCIRCCFKRRRSEVQVRDVHSPLHSQRRSTPPLPKSPPPELPPILEIPPASLSLKGSPRECAICLESVEEEEKESATLQDDGTEMKILKCGHVFHLQCIRQWRLECRRKKRSSPCPLCGQV